MYDHRPPRRHALESPRSFSQFLAPFLFCYLGTTFLTTSLPAMRRCLLNSVLKGRSETCLQMLLHCCWPLFAAVVPAYWTLVFRIPDVSARDIEKGERDVPICVHCHHSLHRSEGDDVSDEVRWRCEACGAISGEASEGIEGRWVYGHLGASTFDIERQDFCLQFREADVCEDLRCLSFMDTGSDPAESDADVSGAETCGGGTSPTSSIYLAIVNENLRLRFQTVGQHMLKVRRSSGGAGWGRPIWARRGHGGATLAAASGEWMFLTAAEGIAGDSAPREMEGETEEEGERPPAWQSFAIDPVPQGVGSFHIFELEEDSMAAAKTQSSSSPARQPAEGALSRSATMRGIGLTGKLSNPGASESLGSVHLRVGLDHLVYSFKRQGEKSWPKGAVAVRRGPVVCTTCGLASGPPTREAPHAIKHCHICNRCIPGFDHHCRFLNQCVGEHNYHWWLLLVCSVEGLLIAMSATSSFVLMQALSSKAPHHCAVKDCRQGLVWQVARLLGLQVRNAYGLLLGPSVGVGVATTLWMGWLLVYHIQLAMTGRKTIEAILDVSAADIFERRMWHYRAARWEAATEAQRRNGGLWVQQELKIDVLDDVENGEEHGGVCMSSKSSNVWSPRQVASPDGGTSPARVRFPHALNVALSPEDSAVEHGEEHGGVRMSSKSSNAWSPRRVASPDGGTSPARVRLRAHVLNAALSPEDYSLAEMRYQVDGIQP